VSLVFIFMNYNRSAKEKSKVYTPCYSEPGTKSSEQRCFARIRSVVTYNSWGLKEVQE
jgi:hypothetical protein